MTRRNDSSHLSCLRYGTNAVMVATYEGHTDTLALLLKHRCDVNVTNDDAQTALMAAVEMDNVEAAKLLLDHNADVYSAGMHPVPLLVMAMHNRPEPNVEMVRLLLNHGAGVNERDMLGWSPLTIAASRNNLEVAEVLLNYGAWKWEGEAMAEGDEWDSEVSFNDETNHTAMMAAGGLGFARFIRLLGRYGVLADPRSCTEPQTDPDDPIVTGLGMAALYGKVKAVGALLDCGAQLVLGGDRGEDPGLCDVFVTAASGETSKTIDTLLYLVARGAIGKGSRERVLQIARSRSITNANVEVARLLRELINGGGWGMLRAAAAGRYWRLAAQLLRSGATDPDMYPAGTLLHAATSKEPWPQATPRLVCPTTVRLIKRALSGWSRGTHHLYHAAFRAAIHTVLHIHERFRRGDPLVVSDTTIHNRTTIPAIDTAAAAAAVPVAFSAASTPPAAPAVAATATMLPRLPIELWLYVIFPLMPRSGGWAETPLCLKTDRVTEKLQKGSGKCADSV